MFTFRAEGTAVDYREADGPRAWFPYVNTGNRVKARIICDALNAWAGNNRGEIAASIAEPLQLPRLLGKRPALGAPYGESLPWAGCPEPRQESDEYACSCGLRWDTHEERPPCPRKL